MLQESLQAMQRTIGDEDKRTKWVVQALSDLKDKRESSASNDNCTLHVRGVGGELEDDENIGHFFSQFGLFKRATVRHRTDEAGNNTSWALVTMMDKESTQRVLAARPVRHTNAEGQTKELNINLFSPKTAATSKGGMVAARMKGQVAATTTTKKTGRGVARNKAAVKKKLMSKPASQQASIVVDLVVAHS